MTTDLSRGDASASSRPTVPNGLSEVITVLSLVALFAIMRRWAVGTLRLPEDAYRSPVLAFEVLRALVWSPRGLVALVPLLALGVIRRDELRAPWSHDEGDQRTRYLILFLVVWATWATVTLDHNLFYDQSYNVDRAILVGLAALTFWRPAFVIPHVFLFIAFEHQFDHPLGRQIFARGILEDLLLLFSAFVLIRIFLRRLHIRWFVFVGCALLASFYWYPGYIKLTRDWFSYGQLYLGGFASYANGWLAFLPTESVERFMRLGAALDWPGRILTMVCELGAVFFFLNRRAAPGLLLAWAALHVGIWMFSGISFLVWVAVDIAFLVLFFRKPTIESDVFGRWFAIGGAALVLASPFWVKPPAVGWFDTKLVYTYRFEAIADGGERAAFPADATPLGEAWCARDFPFLSAHNTLLVRYGKTNDRELAGAVAALDGTPASVFALEASMGEIYYDEQQALEFDRFLGAIATNWNRRGSQRHALGWAAPPRTCLSPRSPPEPLIAARQVVRQIIVYQLTFLFDGRRFAEIRRVPVRWLDIPGVTSS